MKRTLKEILWFSFTLCQKTIFRASLINWKLTGLCWLPRGLFWRKLMFHYLFISLLVDTVSALMISVHTLYIFFSFSLFKPRLKPGLQMLILKAGKEDWQINMNSLHLNLDFVSFSELIIGTSTGIKVGERKKKHKQVSSFINVTEICLFLIFIF